MDVYFHITYPYASREASVYVKPLHPPYLTVSSLTGAHVTRSLCYRHMHGMHYLIPCPQQQWTPLEHIRWMNVAAQSSPVVQLCVWKPNFIIRKHGGGYPFIFFWIPNHKFISPILNIAHCDISVNDPCVIHCVLYRRLDRKFVWACEQPYYLRLFCYWFPFAPSRITTFIVSICLPYKLVICFLPSVYYFGSPDLICSACLFQ